MKKWRKLAAFVLAVTMVVMAALPVFAQEGTYSITIAPTTKNHTYTVYQIFSGDLSADGVLSNIEWGSSISNSGTFLQALITQNDTKYGSCTTAAGVAEQLTSAEDLDEFLEVLNTGSHLGNAAATQTATDTSITISLTAAGYYLVKDTLTGDGENEFVSDYIVQVLGTETVAPKGDVATFEKKVKDINDTTDVAGSYTGWQDSADHDIGDNVPFRLAATVGSDYDRYEEYTFIIHDTQSPGLTLNADSFVVKVGDQTVQDTEYSVVTTGLDDDCTFHVVFGDLKQLTSATVRAGTVISVEYTSTLNENAVIGSAGNPNEAYLEYSNNPYAAGTGKTPKDTVIVFTYKVNVNKVDGDNGDAPLAGAAFKLEKKLQNGTWSTVKQVAAGETTTFEFKGLDDGTYRLIETQTPAGYNSIDAIEFTVVAIHDPTGLTLTGLSVTEAKFVDEDGAEITGGGLGTITFTRDQQHEDALVTTVANHKGVTLPETGGRGTAAFYLLGGLMVAASGALLFLRFRKGVSDRQ